jgi:hypothetical protein
LALRVWIGKRAHAQFPCRLDEFDPMRKTMW